MEFVVHQYSSGLSRQVEERSASVITQIRSPFAVLYADKIREPLAMARCSRPVLIAHFAEVPLNMPIYEKCGGFTALTQQVQGTRGCHDLPQRKRRLCR